MMLVPTDSFQGFAGAQSVWAFKLGSWPNTKIQNNKIKMKYIFCSACFNYYFYILYYSPLKQKIK